MRYTLLAVFVLSACAHRQATDTREHEQDPDETGSGGGAGLGTTAPYVWSRMAPGRFTTSQTYPQFFGERVTGVAIAPSTVTAVSYTATAGSNVDALILTAGAEIQWGAGAAILSGTSDEVTAEGTFQSAGTLTAADYRAIGTTTFDVNAHAASGTAITLDCSVNLGASDFCLKVRDNGTTDLFTLSGTAVATFAGTLGNTTATTALTVDDAEGLKVTSKTLATCASGLEWTLAADAASGVSTGARSRMCMCTSDGAGSPAYAWQNIVTANVGNTTTCPP